MTSNGIETYKFKDIDPLILTEVPPSILNPQMAAYVEDGERHEKFNGQVWIEGGWFTVAKARQLRDWLDMALPGAQP